MDDVNLGTVLREEGGFLHGGVAATDDGERLAAEDRGGAVAHGARRDPAVPVAVGAIAGAFEGEAFGDGAGGDDDGISLDGLGICENPKRTFREIYLCDGLGEDLCAEAL